MRGEGFEQACGNHFVDSPLVLRQTFGQVLGNEQRMVVGDFGIMTGRRLSGVSRKADAMAAKRGYCCKSVMREGISSKTSSDI